MYTSSRHAVIVGIVLVSATICLMFLAVRIKGPTGGANAYELMAPFGKVNGLEQGSPVSVAGVNAGTVQSIEYNSATRRITVKLLVEGAFRIPKESTATIRAKSLLGAYYVDFTPGAAAEPYRPGDVVATRDPTGIDDVLESAGGLGQQADVLIGSFNQNQDELFASLQALVEENRENVKAATEALAEAAPKVEATIDSIKAVTDALNAGEGTLGKLLKDDRLYTDVTAMAADLRAVSKGLAEGEGSLGKLLKSDEAYNDLKGTLDRAEKAFKSADETFAEFKQVAGDLKTVVADNRDGLKELIDSLKSVGPSIDKTFENFNQLSTKINEGEGTLGKIINDAALYEDTQRAMRQIEAAFEVGEEQSVIRTFFSVFLGAAIF